MKMMGVATPQRSNSRCSSGPDISGIETSRIRQRVVSKGWLARNSAADSKALAAKPSSLNRSGSDSRTDSSSSTTETRARSMKGVSSFVLVTSLHNAPLRGTMR